MGRRGIRRRKIGFNHESNENRLSIVIDETVFLKTSSVSGVEIK